jgi:hypothetical protein
MESGYIVWEGKSVLDQSIDIVAIATMQSNNQKTGDMVQTWIMRSDMHPHEALKSGEDSPVCGDCPLRSGQGCYVNVAQAPAAVWKSYKRGLYPKLPSNLKRIMRAREIRLGAYGDPVAVPYDVWDSIVQVVPEWTGYTHQWRTCDQRFNNLLMASTHSIQENAVAHSMGWRTFRAKLEGEDLAPNEFYCPSDRGIECRECLACDGTHLGTRRSTFKSVAIDVHGSSPKLKRAIITLNGLRV